MNEIIVHVDNLGKLYRIGERQRYKTLRDAITNAFATPLRRIKQGLSSKDKTPDYIWALKDVSFEIKKGEVVGIIGRNGAGKTTLLKILSRITPPTEGYAKIYGIASSLLEVGTGFHPELTGRDNIYLNGAILGMKKVEISRRFDEIVTFAEIEKFIDTPLKHYSNGMYVRLAFAVAAHLEPEIFLVDEVLAVGDIAFQKKCLGRMDDMAKRGRTVLFVSHQMNQVRRLCERCIWLEDGYVKKIGDTVEVISAYETASSSLLPQVISDRVKERVTVSFLKWEIIDPHHEQANVLSTIGPVTVRFTLKINKAIRKGIHGIALFNNENQLIWSTCTSNIMLDRGSYEFIYELSSLPLKPSVYFWRVSLYDDNGKLDVWDCVPELIVATKPITHIRDEWIGILNIPYKFNIQNSG